MSRFVWLDDPAALDQILLTQVSASVWIAECGTRQGCWASAETPTGALDLLSALREQYDATHRESSPVRADKIAERVDPDYPIDLPDMPPSRSCGCTCDPDTGEHHDRDGWRCTHTSEEKR